MIYSVEIETLKGGSKTKLKRTPLVITKGLVYKVEFYFPSGSAGLMGVALFDGNYSVWPSTIGQFFIGDDVLIGFDDMYLKESKPFVFDIYTYNLDTEYNHSLSVRVGLVSKEVYLARFLPTVTYKFFAEMLSKVQVEQQQSAAIQKEAILQTPFEWLLNNDIE